MDNTPWYIRSEARGLGHPPKVGGLTGSTPGRADHLPIAVPSGSHVIPARAVSAIGQGNTMNGMEKLHSMFGSGPYGMKPMSGSHGLSKPPPFPNVHKPDSAPTQPSLQYADGGGVGKPVEIMASDGEYIVPPSKVLELGDGNQEHGHAILDKFIMHIINHEMQDIKNYPGPAKD